MSVHSIGLKIVGTSGSQFTILDCQHVSNAFSVSGTSSLSVQGLAVINAQTGFAVGDSAHVNMDDVSVFTSERGVFATDQTRVTMRNCIIKGCAGGPTPGMVATGRVRLFLDSVQIRENVASSDGVFAVLGGAELVATDLTMAANKVRMQLQASNSSYRFHHCCGVLHRLRDPECWW